MPKRTTLSIEEHKALANELREAHKVIKGLFVKIYSSFPIEGDQGKSWEAMRKAETAIFEARAYAEQNFKADHPDKADPYTYFPDQDPGPNWPKEHEECRQEALRKYDVKKPS